MTDVDTFKCLQCSQVLVLPKSVDKVIGRCPYCDRLIVIQLDKNNNAPIYITEN